MASREPSRTAGGAYEARNIYGALVRTFSHLEQARDYQSHMAALGSEITIRRAWTQRRVAA